MTTQLSADIRTPDETLRSDDGTQEKTPRKKSREKANQGARELAEGWLAGFNAGRARILGLLGVARLERPVARRDEA